jgi:2-deoxy-D-gluconate 3-dehydrogenase
VRWAAAWEVSADLADRDATLAMADEALAAGPIDVLVNNGGTIRGSPAVDHPLEDWDAVLRTNLDAVFLLSQRVGRGMIERGAGKIVNVASLLSFSGGITVPGYTASKHAVAGLTKALANEWARHGVQVNAIAPGYFATDNTERLRATRRGTPRSARASRRPVGRAGATSAAPWCSSHRGRATT